MPAKVKATNPITDITFVPENAIELVQDGMKFVSENIGDASRFISLIKGVKSARDASFLKKLQAFLQEYSAVSVPIRGQVLANLHAVHGIEYFQESLFSAIETADSVQRSHLFSQLLSMCANGSIPNEEYYSILFVFKNIQIEDLKKLESAVKWQKKLNKTQGEDFTQMTKNIEKEIGMRTLIRFQSVALARSANVYGGSRIPFINVSFASLVLKAMQDN